ncbi:hypothetical protein Taro_032618 [Colocasia esculenta]|uniref:Uncharacterized protein n=1 Tax=Colocasia esculenta TaxID=4460 RepID=A0A843VLS7_COLES|nr:hypothetical protein [Colocasia esculenta]
MTEPSFSLPTPVQVTVPRANTIVHSSLANSIAIAAVPRANSILLCALLLCDSALFPCSHFADRGRRFFVVRLAWASLLPRATGRPWASLLPRATGRPCETAPPLLGLGLVQLSYMAERKSSTTAPQNEGKGMTNMGQTEEGRGSSTSPAPMDVDELEKVVHMAVNVGTLNREEEKEEYEVLAVEEEENPEATIPIKHGKAIDIGYQFLIEKMENSPNQYHTCTYTPALLVHSFQSRKAKIMERVTLLDAFFKFCCIMDDPLELVYDDQCPDQSYDSTDCALFVIKFMETISRKG